MPPIPKKAFLHMMEEIAPSRFAEGFDNPGLLLDMGQTEYAKILLALDLTLDTAREAIDLGADLLLTHHPIFFQAAKRLSVHEPSQQAALMLVRAGISHYAAHTNWDSAAGGVNGTLCKLLGLDNPFSLEPKGGTAYKFVIFAPVEAADGVRLAIAKAGGGLLGHYSHCSFSARGEGRFLPLPGAQPKIGGVGSLEEVAEERIECFVTEDRLQDVRFAALLAHPYETPAYDIFKQAISTEDQRTGLTHMGALPEPLRLEDFARMVAEKLDCAALKYAGDPNALVKTVAVSTGAGGGSMYLAAAHGADAFITGEVKHHEALESYHLGIAVLEAGHYETEKPAMLSLAEGLQSRLNPLHYNTECILSSRERNPMNGVE